MSERLKGQKELMTTAGLKMGGHVGRNLSGLKELRAVLGQRPSREWRDLTLRLSGMVNLEEHSRLQMRTVLAAILILACESHAGNPTTMLAQT